MSKSKKRKRLELELSNCEDILKNDPKDTVALNRKGDLLFELKLYEDALKIYETLLEIGSEDAKTMSKLGNSLFKLKRYEAAIEIYDKVLSIEPDNQEAWYNINHSFNNLGTICLTCGKYDEALGIFNELLQVKPFVPRKKSLDELYAEYYKEGLKMYNSTPNIKPLNLDENYSYDSLIILLKHINDSFDSITFTQSFWKKRDEVWGRGQSKKKEINVEEEFGKEILGKILDSVKYLFDSKEYDKLVKLYHKTLELRVSNEKKKFFEDRVTSFISECINVSVISNEYEEVIKTCDVILEIDPMDEKYFELKREILYKLKRSEEAIKVCDILLDINPKNVKSCKFKGDLLYELKRYDEVIINCEKMLEFNSNDEKVWLQKADALFELNNYFGALHVYEKALEINPYWPGLWRKKGNALSKLGFYDEAQEAYSKFEELSNKEESGKRREWYEIDNPINRYHLYK